MTESEMEKTTKEFWKFGDVQIKKIEFYCSKKAIYENNGDVGKILISNEFAHGKNKEINVNISLDTKKVKN